jgi:hypothetical protein
MVMYVCSITGLAIVLAKSMPISPSLVIESVFFTHIVSNGVEII